MSRILLIEDNPANRRLIGDHLRRAGYEVVALEAADLGVARARDGGIDLVVMDVQLPGIDGLAATGMLRADPATRDLPVLAVTAHAMRGDEARILAAGCDGYVAKPIDYHEFLAQVARLLAGGRRTRDEAVP